MKVNRLHSWDVTPAEAIRIQQQIRERVTRRGRILNPEFVAGADAAFDTDANRVYAAVVVLRFPSLEPVETVISRSRLTFPYVPGLLAFREAPALLRAFARVQHDPQVVFIDGHGVSHPRAAGIACHIGLSLDRPVVGCAKSLLTGTYKEPAASHGATSPVYDEAGSIVGAAVRTRDRVRPVFISIGHKISLAEAVRLTLACGKGYRIPESTRQADLLAERAKRETGFRLRTPSRRKAG